MAGLIIEGCATFVEYLGALNFIGDKLNKKHQGNDIICFANYFFNRWF